MLNNDEEIDRPLPLGPTAFRLIGEGDFNIELDREALIQGDNTVEIIATDRNGNEAGQTVTVRYAPASSCPLPHSVNWDQTKEINDVAQVVDGLWRLTDDGVRTVEIGYDRIIAIGDGDTQDLIACGVAYRLKARAESRPDTPSLYRMKVWPADQGEPDGWQLEGLGGQGELDRGSLLLVAHNADVTFGDVTVTAV